MGKTYIAGLVSVVVTAYNYADFIVEMLNSVSGQSYRPLEIIFVDDNSTDATGAVAGHWRGEQSTKNADHDFYYLRLPKNCGYAGAVSVGFHLADGEYIAIQDADDLSHPDRISKQVAFLRSHPDISIVGTNYCAFNSDHPHMTTYPTFIRYGEEIKKSYSEGSHCVSVGTILFRRAILENLGEFNNRLEGAEDYDFIARAISSGLLVENLPEVLYYYRSHQRQRSHQFYG